MLRVLLLAAALAVLGSAALPSAGACHPAYEMQVTHASHGVRVFVGMPCDHMPPYDVCVSAWGPSWDVGAVC